MARYVLYYLINILGLYLALIIFLFNLNQFFIILYLMKILIIKLCTYNFLLMITINKIIAFLIIGYNLHILLLKLNINLAYLY